jgi:hypothetical protein
MGTVHRLIPRDPRRARPLPLQLAELALAVPQVVAHRTARMAMAGTPLSARDRKEFELMHSEKTAAFAEAWLALWWQAALAQQRLMLALMTGSTLAAPATLAHALTHSAMQVLGHGLAPVHRHATANARRLTRLRLK